MAALPVSPCFVMSSTRALMSVMPGAADPILAFTLSNAAPMDATLCPVAFAVL